MLVTCPECNAKINSESEDCKRCGLPGAAGRSLELCKDFLGRLKNLPLVCPGTGNSVSVTQPLAWHIFEEQCRRGFNPYARSYDARGKLCSITWLEEGSGRGDFDQYVQLVDSNIGKNVHGGCGYQVNIILECRICKEKFSCHIYPYYDSGAICDTCVRRII